MATPAQLKKLAEERRLFDQEVRKEFRMQVYTGITAALALIIALAWREPIELSSKQLLTWLSLPTEGVLAKLFVAVVITVVAAVGLVIMGRWARKKGLPGK